MCAVYGALKWSGRGFQMWGAAEMKALSPMVQSLILRRWQLLAQRFLLDDFWQRSALRYSSALLWMHWWVRRAILYWILMEMGSQWSERRIGVMWSCFHTHQDPSSWFEYIGAFAGLARNPDEKCLAVVQPVVQQRFAQMFDVFVECQVRVQSHTKVGECRWEGNI